MNRQKDHMANALEISGGKFVSIFLSALLLGCMTLSVSAKEPFLPQKRALPQGDTLAKFGINTGNITVLDGTAVSSEIVSDEPEPEKSGQMLLMNTAGEPAKTTSASGTLPEPDLDNDSWPGWSFTASAGDSYNVKFRVTNSPAGPDWDADLYDVNHALYMGNPYNRDFESGWEPNWATARSPEIAVPTADQVTIQWRDWHKIEDYGGGDWDECRFYVHDLDTNQYYLLTNWWGYYTGSPYQPYWVTYSFDINQVAGHRIQIYLTFDTKDALFNRVDVFGQRVYGWFIDDILVEADGATIYNEPFDTGIRAGRDITVRDTIATSNNMAIDFSSMNLDPVSATTDETGNTTIEWNFSQIKIGEEILIGFDVRLFDLTPNEEREVNNQMTLSYVNVDGFIAETRMGPQSVSVKMPVDLSVKTDKDVYGFNQNVVVNANFSLGANSAATFSSSSEWATGTLDHVAASLIPGMLCLEPIETYPVENLVPDGDFENGTSDWSNAGDVWSYVASNSPIDGAYSMGAESYGIGGVFRQVTIPPDAYSARFSFIDRKDYGGNSDDYRVEIRNPANEVLKTLHQSNDVSWTATARGFDLTEFKGQTIRLYFHMKNYYGGYYCFDNFKLEIEKYRFAALGTASFIVDAACQASWDKITCRIPEIDNTTISFRARSGNSINELPDMDFGTPRILTSECESAELSVRGGRYLEVEFTLSTDNESITPLFDWFRISSFKALPENELLLRLFIHDKNGQLVKLLKEQPINPGAGKNQSVTLTYNTGGQTPERYFAYGEILWEGDAVAIDRDDFEIVDENAGLVVVGNIATNKLEYAGHETITIDSRTFNHSACLNMNNLNVAIEVLDSENNVVETFSFAIANLLANSCHRQNVHCDAGALGRGVYTVSQKISDGENILAESSATFSVVASVEQGKGVIGSIAPDSTIIKRRSGTLQLALAAQNTGNVDLSDVTLKTVVFNPVTFEEIRSFVSAVDLMLDAAAYSAALAYGAVDLLPGDYPVSLTAELVYNGQDISIPLDMNGFTVTNDPPVARAGEDVSAEGTSPDNNPVTLSAAASTDANSTNPPGMDDDIVSYEWHEGETLLGTGRILIHPFAWGVHHITLTVKDSLGLVATDTVDVDIVDTIAPAIENLSPANDVIAGSVSPVFGASVADSCSGVDYASAEFTVDGATLPVVADESSGTVSAVPAEPLPDGWHDLVLKISDRAGNQASTAWRVGVDTVPPVIDNLVPANGSAGTAFDEVSANISDAFSGIDTASIELKINGDVVVHAYDAQTGKVAAAAPELQTGISNIAVAVRDIVGNQASASWAVTVQAPAGDWLVFHDASTGTLNISGSGKTVDGKVHSNAGIKISGSNNTISGETTAVADIKVSGAKNNVPYRQPGAPAQPLPVYQLSYYQQHADHNHDGNWHVSGSNTSIPAGIHFVSGNVKISGSRVSGNVTIVATGSIHVSGSNVSFTSADVKDNMLLFGVNGIKLSGSGDTLGGIIYAPSGECDLSGARKNIRGSIIGNKVSITGANVSVSPINQ